MRKVAKRVLDHGLDTGVALNINIPKSKTSEKIKGIKVCRQANAKWEEEFEKRIDPKETSIIGLQENLLIMMIIMIRMSGAIKSLCISSASSNR